MSVALIGVIAACMTTGAWVPQLLRTRRLRSADDLSWVYLATMLLGLTSWLVYGTARHDAALLGAHAVSLTLVLALSAF
jgi:MtN3 and saliva related transmembrane protein